MNYSLNLLNFKFCFLKGYPQQIGPQPQQQQQPPQNPSNVNIPMPNGPHQQPPNSYMNPGMPLGAEQQQKHIYANNMAPQQPAPPQFMSPQHQPQPATNPNSYMPTIPVSTQPQQQAPQQYSGLPNGPQSYMMPPSAGAPVSTAPPIPQMNNYTHEQISQLQHQLASMAMGGMQQQQQQQQQQPQHLPSQQQAQQIPPQSQNMSNIPIYQQQP